MLFYVQKLNIYNVLYIIIIFSNLEYYDVSIKKINICIEIKILNDDTNAWWYYVMYLLCCVRSISFHESVIHRFILELKPPNIGDDFCLYDLYIINFINYISKD